MRYCNTAYRQWGLLASPPLSPLWHSLAKHYISKSCIGTVFALDRSRR